MLATRTDTMAPCIMVQSAVLEPSGPPHPNNGYPQDQPQELASTLRHVVIEHDSNTNPSHRAVLFFPGHRWSNAYVEGIPPIHNRPRRANPDTKNRQEGWKPGPFQETPKQHSLPTGKQVSVKEVIAEPARHPPSNKIKMRLTVRVIPQPSTGREAFDWEASFDMTRSRSLRKHRRTLWISKDHHVTWPSHTARWSNIFSHIYLLER